MHVTNDLTDLVSQVLVLGKEEISIENFKDHQWLIDGIQSHVMKTGDNRSLDILSFAFVHHACLTQNECELRNIFPKRTLTPLIVHQYSVEELLNLRSEDYFAIADLISGEQALQILESGASQERKMVLYYYNHELAESFAKIQRALYEKTLEEKIQVIAEKALQVYKTYNRQELENLQTKKCYEVLDCMRLELSDTLKIKNKSSQINQWKYLNQRYLSNGLEQPVTKKFLLAMNSILCFITIYQPPDQLGYRKGQREITDLSRELYYLPGRAVKKEIKHFIQWLNQEMTACDQKTHNPLIVAAAIYQRFVTIHPFMDANGRTGRFLADLFLRRYHILPVAWNNQDICTALFPIGRRKNLTSVEQAVRNLLRGLNRSYLIVDEIDNQKDEEKVGFKTQNLGE